MKTTTVFGRVHQNAVAYRQSLLCTVDNVRASDTPFGQLPVLEMEGGIALGQSLAVARYLARKFGEFCNLHR